MWRIRGGCENFGGPLTRISRIGTNFCSSQVHSNGLPDRNTIEDEDEKEDEESLCGGEARAHHFLGEESPLGPVFVQFAGVDLVGEGAEHVTFLSG